METKDWRYALTAYATGSFAKAAESLYVSRQAVSQVVRRLESETGITLFTVRGNNQLVATPEGKKLLEEVRPIVEAFDDFVRRTGRHGEDEQIAGSLSIALATGVSLSLGEEFFERFRTLEPLISQSMEETSTSGALELLKNAEVDIALVGSCPAYLADFDHMLVMRTGLWVAVPNDNPLSERPHLEVGDLDGQSFVTAGRLNHLHRLLVERCSAAGVEVLIPASSSNADMLGRLVGEYHAMAFVFPQVKIEGYTVMSLDLDGDEGGTDFGTYAVRRKAMRLPAAAARFWEYARTVAP